MDFNTAENLFLKVAFKKGIITFLSLLRLDELGPHVGAHDVGAPKVSHPEHQAELVVSQRNDGVLGEHQRLGSLVGLRDLHEHAADLEFKMGGEANRSRCVRILAAEDLKATPCPGLKLNTSAER